MRNVLTHFLNLLLLACLSVGVAHAQQQRAYLLGAGDVIRITVFQNPDMQTDTRVSDLGYITFPLIGSLQVGGGTTTQAEQKIAAALKSGGFVLKPQVNVVVQQFRARQVSVLGYVNRPGRYPMEDQVLHLADVLSLAGGTTLVAADQLFVVRNLSGKEERIPVDLEAAISYNDLGKNFEIFAGDTIYVPKQQYIYIYGQVNRPGQYRLERNMTVMQGLAVGGGVTLRGTEKGLTVRRRDAGGKVDALTPNLQDKLQADDVIYVRESLF